MRQRTTASHPLAAPAPLALLTLGLMLGQGACDTGEPLPAKHPSQPSKDDQPSAGNARLVHRLTLPSGNRIDFLQTPDESMFVHERGTYPARPTQIALASGQRSAIDLFRYLAPGESIPSELSLAVDRLEQRKRALGTRPRPTIHSLRPEAQALAQAAITWTGDQGNSPDGCPFDWFQANLCWDIGDPGDVCQADVRFAKNRADVHHAYTASCTAVGNTKVTLKYSYCAFFWCPTHTLFSDTQPANEWWKDVLTDSTTDFWMSYSVVPSAGGRAHTALHHAF
jgi:hypothetical protein